METPEEKDKSSLENKRSSKIVDNYYEKLKAEFDTSSTRVSIIELEALIRKVVREEISNSTQKQPEAPEQRYLSIKEAAKYLHLAVATIYEKTSARLIPFHKRDKKLYFLKEELDGWLIGNGISGGNFKNEIAESKRAA